MAHLLLRRGRAADEAADDLAEEQLGARGGRVHADAQPRDVDALGDHQHRDEPAARAGGEARDPRGRVRGVGGDDLRPLAGDPREPVGELLGVLLVDRHDQPAGVRMRARAQRRSWSSASRSTCAIQSPSGSSAVRRRRAASAAGQHDVEVGAAAAAVAHPLHVAVVGVERDRPAHAVEQRLRVAVGVVGARDAVVVVGHPRDRRVVRAERRAGEQQAEAGALEGRPRPAPPGRVLAHVVRLVGDQQRRRLRAAAAVERPGRRRPSRR